MRWASSLSYTVVRLVWQIVVEDSGIFSPCLLLLICISLYWTSSCVPAEPALCLSVCLRFVSGKILWLDDESSKYDHHNRQDTEDYNEDVIVSWFIRAVGVVVVCVSTGGSHTDRKSFLLCRVCSHTSVRGVEVLFVHSERQRERRAALVQHLLVFEPQQCGLSVHPTQ